LKAAKNTSWLDLAGNFYSQAAKEGNTVIEAGQEVTCSEETKADYKAAKEAVKQERIDGLLAAKDINELTYKYLKDSTSGKTKEVKAQIERYEMARFYGLPVTKELIELDKEGRFRRNIENFLSIMKPEYSKVIDRANLSNPQIMLADVSHLNVQAQCRFNVLAKAGLIGDTFAQFDADSLNKSGFVTWLKENQSRIERVLNMSINLDLPVQTLASVLGQIGLKLKDKQVRATDGKRKRIYQIDQENYFKVEDMAKAHFEAFEKRRNDKEQGVIVSAIRYEELPLKVA
jgi:hypothetical protein